MSLEELVDQVLSRNYESEPRASTDASPVHQSPNEDGSPCIKHASTANSARISEGSNVLPFATLTREDLKYEIGFVRQQVRTLPAKSRERFNYWLDLIQSSGYEREPAERGAFYRTIKFQRREYR